METTSPFVLILYGLNRLISHVQALQSTVHHILSHPRCSSVSAIYDLSVFVDQDTKSLKIAKLYKCCTQNCLCLVCEWAVWIILMVFK